MQIQLLECPACRIDERDGPLKQANGGLSCGTHHFPIKESITDLRLPSNQRATSYDAILPEWSRPRIDDPETLMAAYGVTTDMVRGRVVCVGGAGGGTEVAALLALEPKELHGVDYSSFVRTLAERFPGVHFYQGDICNMPFGRGIFDLIVSGGVIQATPSPELAVRSMVRCLKPGGHLAIANIYKQGLHNRRVTIHRNRHEFHRMEPERAKRLLRRNARAFYLLCRVGLLKLHRRVPIPGFLEYANLPGMSAKQLYDNALDYYLSAYRHTISEAEFEGYCAALPVTCAGTHKGYLVTRANVAIG